MVKTDYSKIANNYDKNKFYRFFKLEDDAFERFVKKSSKSTINFLEIGCGTGNYLEKNVALYDESKINWNALEPAEDMLNLAKEKVQKNVNFISQKFEDASFESNSFDYIYSRAVFHHFPDKKLVLDKIIDILAPGGFFKLENSDIYSMKKWWVYKFFPKTYNLDEDRFWTIESIIEYFEKKGLEVYLDEERHYYKMPAEAVYYMAKVRDVSQLHIIDEEYYNANLVKIKELFEKDPKQLISTENSWYSLYAKKI